MSELGNIIQSYGKQFNIAVANTSGSVIEKQTTLPANTLIITAPMSDGKDIGTHALFITDYKGTPVRLTYTIQLGNGLQANAENTDKVYIQYDTNTIALTDANALSAAIENIVNSSELVCTNNKITLHTDNLDIATDTVEGLVKIDNSTIKIDSNGSIYVETSNLDVANNSQYGIVTSDNSTTTISDTGVLSVGTLQDATITQYGIVQVDGTTIYSTDGVISVQTENLTKCSVDEYGVAQPDNTTIKLDNDTLYVDSENLTHTSSNEYGVVKIDDTLQSDNGILSVCDYDTLVNKLSDILTKMEAAEKTINELNEKLSNS